MLSSSERLAHYGRENAIKQKKLLSGHDFYPTHRYVTDKY